jgi:hypothetical protein
MSKICSKCKEDKPDDSFSIRKDRNTLASACRSCNAKLTGLYRKANRAKVNAYNKSKYPENKNAIKNWKLKDKYGISLLDRENILVQQNGCCAICKIREANLTKSLAVDHCHKTLKVRGLLCDKCNVGIGYFNDNVELLEKAKLYLEHT